MSRPQWAGLIFGRRFFTKLNASDLKKRFGDRKQDWLVQKFELRRLHRFNTISTEPYFTSYAASIYKVLLAGCFRPVQPINGRALKRSSIRDPTQNLYLIFLNCRATVIAHFSLRIFFCASFFGYLSGPYSVAHIFVFWIFAACNVFLNDNVVIKRYLFCTLHVTFFMREICDQMFNFL